MNKSFEKILELIEQNTLKNRDSISFFNECGINFISASKAKEIVQKVEREYNGGWIPCSDRLPDVEADVLLSLRSIDVHTGFMSNTEGYFYIDGEGYVEFENVLAWQPLPEPYKECD